MFILKANRGGADPMELVPLQPHKTPGSDHVDIERGDAVPGPSNEHKNTRTEGNNVSPRSHSIITGKCDDFDKIESINEDPPAVEQSTEDTIRGAEAVSMAQERAIREAQKKLNNQLMSALKDKNIEDIERSLAEGADPNGTCVLSDDGCHLTACHLAVENKLCEALSLLIAHGADTTKAVGHGVTPLHLAAREDNVRLITILLGCSEDLEKRILSEDITTEETKEQLKLLPQTVKNLVNRKCEENICKSCYNRDISFRCVRSRQNLVPGGTALHVASFYGYPKITSLLIAAGANRTALDAKGRTPLDIIGSNMHATIDPDNFTEVVKIFLNLECYKTFKRADDFSPICTAVSVGSLEGIRLLVEAGMPVNWTKYGNTALHLCVIQRCLYDTVKFLEVLVKGRCDDGTLKAVDVRDKDGQTMLHLSVYYSWQPGVSLALQSGADITAKDNNGKSVLHYAAAADLDTLNIIWNEIKKNNHDINPTNNKNESPLFEAIENGKVDGFKKLLKEGASIKTVNSEGWNVFHAVAKSGDFDKFQALIEHYNHAYTRFKDKNKMLTAKTKDQSTVMQMAIEGRNINIIKNIAREGASLPVKHILREFPKPIEIINDILDHNIMHTPILYRHDVSIYIFIGGFRINYAVLGQEKTEQMKFIKELIASGDEDGQKRLLTHPLVESFLYFKWESVQKYFWTIMAIYGFFVLCLTGYIMAEFHYKNKRDDIPVYVLNTTVYLAFVVVALILVIILEGMYIIGQMPAFLKRLKSNYNQLEYRTFLNSIRHWYYLCRHYFWSNLSLEPCIKLSSICLALALLIAVPVVQESDAVWLRNIAAMSLMFSWLEMMFLLSRFPKWGIYVQMFGKVASNVIKILFSFMFLLIGFALSFMILYHSTPPFENYWSAFVKTLVMMTSEYDYGNLVEGNGTRPIPDTKDASKTIVISIELLRFLFIVFVVLIAIVLMNLMVGVAVDDIQTLQKIGTIRRIEKQIEVIELLENILPEKMKRKDIIKEFVFSTGNVNDYDYESNTKIPENLIREICKIAGPVSSDYSYGTIENKIVLNYGDTHQELDVFNDAINSHLNKATRQKIDDHLVKSINNSFPNHIKALKNKSDVIPNEINYIVYTNTKIEDVVNVQIGKCVYKT